MLNWIKSILNDKSDVKQNLMKTFCGLRDLQNNGQPNTKRTYDLLVQLNHSTPNEIFDELVRGIMEIRYASNTNGFFYFFFPIVSHVLYFRPEYESKLLRHLIGPIFANGVSEVQGMMNIITGTMNCMLSSNPVYLTTEGKSWVKENLPNLHQEIKREIELCIKELDD